jgi:hypothetical protein
MLIWFFTALSGLTALLIFLKLVSGLSETTQNLENQLSLIQWLQRCEEKLICGFPLDPEDFQSSILTEPQYRFLEPWIKELRNSGQALLPTLKGLRDSVGYVHRVLVQSQSKVAPTRLQAKVSIGLILVISLFLYYLLDGPRVSPGVWLVATLGALLLGGFAFLWIESLILQTIWRGSQKKTESQWFAYFLFPERLRGAIQIGQSLDEAWIQSVQSLDVTGLPPPLLSLWTKDPVECGSDVLEVKLLEELRLALQHALFQGTPVSDRIQVWANQCRVQFETDLTGRLETLPHRCLQPLFLCVAPAVIGLLVVGMFLEIQQSFSGMF